MMAAVFVDPREIHPGESRERSSERWGHTIRIGSEDTESLGSCSIFHFPLQIKVCWLRCASTKSGSQAKSSPWRPTNRAFAGKSSSITCRDPPPKTDGTTARLVSSCCGAAAPRWPPGAPCVWLWRVFKGSDEVRLMRPPSPVCQTPDTQQEAEKGLATMEPDTTQPGTSREVTDSLVAMLRWDHHWFYTRTTEDTLTNRAEVFWHRTEPRVYFFYFDFKGRCSATSFLRRFGSQRTTLTAWQLRNWLPFLWWEDDGFLQKQSFFHWIYRTKLKEVKLLFFSHALNVFSLSRKSTSSSTNPASSRCATRTRAELMPGPRRWRRRATATSSNSKKLTKNCRNSEQILWHSCKKFKRWVVFSLINGPLCPEFKKFKIFFWGVCAYRTST